MNRKFVSRVILPILIVVELSFLFLTCMSFSNREVSKVKEVNKIDKEMFSMYVQNETTGEYEETEYFPTGSYKINQTKSICVDNKGNSVSNDVMSYNNGKLTVSSNKTIYCYLYFDVKADFIIEVSTDGQKGKVPTTSGYKNTLSCDNSTYSWNQIYQRIEFGNLTTDEVKCNLDYTQDTETHTTLISEVERVNADQNYNGHGYRYSGSSPNNWVWFNGEKWRIIGSIPACTSSGCATSENLVKIVRNNPIGRYSYDASSTNGPSLKANWGENTLYSLLNTHYYATDETKVNGQNHKGCYNIYDGINNYKVKSDCDFTILAIRSRSYYGRMIKNVYWNTGFSNPCVTPSAAYSNESVTRTVSGYIGLMTLSDWGYAADSSNHSTQICTNVSATVSSWPFTNGYEWTSTAYKETTGGRYRANHVYHNGQINVGGVNYVSANGYAVRPVVYLMPSVYIVDGDGSEENPYQIGM